MLSLLTLLAAICLTPPPQPNPPMPLSIVTYNIRYDEPRDGPDRWDNRKDAAAALLKDHNPDVIGLQEALRHQLDDLEARLPGYAEIGVGRDDGKQRGEYSAILYRKDRLELLDSGTFWLSDTPDTPGSKSWGNNVVRICTWARFREKTNPAHTPASKPGDTPTDKPAHDTAPRTFTLFNTHLDHQSQASREKSAALISKRICSRPDPDAPIIVTGDFNAHEDNPAVLAMEDATQGPGLVDAFRVLHPDEKDAATFNDFGHGPGAREKIDYIFVPKRAKVLEAGIDRRQTSGHFPSDHFALFARIELP
jgi:endonuclease/exonuclease/phosphatase family metal-dependent hydrolase